MAKRKRVIRPYSSLSPRQKRERRIAKTAGFQNEYEYREWIRKHSNLDPNRADYFDPTPYKGNQKGATNAQILQHKLAAIRVAKKAEKLRETTPQEILRKYRLLVLDLHKFTAFSFYQRYIEQIQSLLADPDVSAYRKRQLRSLMKQLENDFTGDQYTKPGEQGVLF